MTALVSITGPIAAGATTLASALAEKMAWGKAFEQDVEAVNPFFASYHAEPQRYAFHNQVAFLGRSAQRHIGLTQSSAASAVIVQDYTPFEHTEVYAHVQQRLGRLTGAEYELLLYLTQVLSSVYVTPRVLVYRPLRRDALLARVRQRGRPSEQSSDVDFLNAIRDRFDEWATEWKRSPIIRLEEDFDVFADNGAMDQLCGAVLRALS